MLSCRTNHRISGRSWYDEGKFRNDRHARARNHFVKDQEKPRWRLIRVSTKSTFSDLTTRWHGAGCLRQVKAMFAMLLSFHADTHAMETAATELINMRTSTSACSKA